MTVLVVAEAAALLLLGLLVAGLLRSHAEILRRLHDLDEAGVDMTAADRRQRANGISELDFPGVREGIASARDAAEATVVGEISGVTVDDEAVVLGIAGRGRTLLAFLSSGCATCAAFWQRLGEPGGAPVPSDTELVIVTKGEEEESLAALRRLAPPDLPVVMSSAAWRDYAVPGSPYFLLLERGKVVGEGSGGSWGQVLALLHEATGDAVTAARGRRSGRRSGRADRTDQELMAAGILPGDLSLYPSPAEAQQWASDAEGRP